MYRLLAMDIDETVTQTYTTVPEEVIAAVKRARSGGIRVTLSTGRGFLASSMIARQLDIQEPIINYGGAIISDPADGKPIYATKILPELVTAVLNDAMELGVHAHIYEGDTVISEDDNAFVTHYISRLNLPVKTDPQIREKRWDNIPKVLIMTTEENAVRLRPMLQEKYAGRLKISGSSKGFIEINHPDSHKGAALKWLAGHLGIKQEEVVAVGDNSLDIEMIRWAGLGCAMGNAQDAVKAAADIVLPPCSEFGTAWLIDNVLLKDTTAHAHLSPLI